jgi:Arc/MetJ family transcription regulator
LNYTPKYAILGVYGYRRTLVSRTNIELDEKLINEAMQLTHKKTKKDVVNYAVEELVRKLKRKKILELEGHVEWTGDLFESRKSRL